MDIELRAIGPQDSHIRGNANMYATHQGVHVPFTKTHRFIPATTVATFGSTLRFEIRPGQRGTLLSNAFFSFSMDLPLQGLYNGPIAYAVLKTSRLFIDTEELESIDSEYMLIADQHQENSHDNAAALVGERKTIVGDGKVHTYFVPLQHSFSRRWVSDDTPAFPLAAIPDSVLRIDIELKQYAELLYSGSPVKLPTIRDAGLTLEEITVPPEFQQGYEDVRAPVNIIEKDEYIIDYDPLASETHTFPISFKGRVNRIHWVFIRDGTLELSAVNGESGISTSMMKSAHINVKEIDDTHENDAQHYKSTENLLYKIPKDNIFTLRFDEFGDRGMPVGNPGETFHIRTREIDGITHASTIPNDQTSMFAINASGVCTGKVIGLGAPALTRSYPNIGDESLVSREIGGVFHVQEYETASSKSIYDMSPASAFSDAYSSNLKEQISTLRLDKALDPDNQLSFAHVALQPSARDLFPGYGHLQCPTTNEITYIRGQFEHGTKLNDQFVVPNGFHNVLGRISVTTPAIPRYNPQENSGEFTLDIDDDFTQARVLPHGQVTPEFTQATRLECAGMSKDASVLAYVQVSDPTIVQINASSVSYNMTFPVTSISLNSTGSRILVSGASVYALIDDGVMSLSGTFISGSAPSMVTPGGDVLSVDGVEYAVTRDPDPTHYDQNSLIHTTDYADLFVYGHASATQSGSYEFNDDLFIRDSGAPVYKRNITPISNSYTHPGTGMQGFGAHGEFIDDNDIVHFRHPLVDNIGTVIRQLDSASSPLTNVNPVPETFMYRSTTDLPFPMKITSITKYFDAPSEPFVPRTFVVGDETFNEQPGSMWNGQTTFLLSKEYITSTVPYGCEVTTFDQIPQPFAGATGPKYHKVVAPSQEIIITGGQGEHVQGYCRDPVESARVPITTRYSIPIRMGLNTFTHPLRIVSTGDIAIEYIGDGIIDSIEVEEMYGTLWGHHLIPVDAVYNELLLHPDNFDSLKSTFEYDFGTMAYSISHELEYQGITNAIVRDRSNLDSIFEMEYVSTSGLSVTLTPEYIPAFDLIEYQRDSGPIITPTIGTGVPYSMSFECDKDYSVPVYLSNGVTVDTSISNGVHFANLAGQTFESLSIGQRAVKNLRIQAYVSISVSSAPMATYLPDETKLLVTSGDGVFFQYRKSGDEVIFESEYQDAPRFVHAGKYRLKIYFVSPKIMRIHKGKLRMD